MALSGIFLVYRKPNWRAVSIYLSSSYLVFYKSGDELRERGNIVEWWWLPTDLCSQRIGVQVYWKSSKTHSWMRFNLDVFSVTKQLKLLSLLILFVESSLFSLFFLSPNRWNAVFGDLQDMLVSYWFEKPNFALSFTRFTAEHDISESTFRLETLLNWNRYIKPL